MTSSPSLPVLRQLLNEATSLPWEVEEDWIWGASSGGGAFGELVLRDEACLLPEDAALIVAAVNALPDLIAELEAKDVLVARQAAAIEAVQELHGNPGMCVECCDAQPCDTSKTLTRLLSGITPTTEENPR